MLFRSSSMAQKPGNTRADFAVYLQRAMPGIYAVVEPIPLQEDEPEEIKTESSDTKPEPMDFKTEFTDSETESKDFKPSEYIETKTEPVLETRTVTFRESTPTPLPSSPLPGPSHSHPDPDVLILDLSPADRDIEDQPGGSVRDHLGPTPAKRPVFERLGSRM